MSTKYPKGSAGAAESKQNKIFFILVVIAAIAILALEFIIPNILRDEVKQSSRFAQIVGGIFSSAVPGFFLYKAVMAGEEGSSGWTLAAAGSLVVGLLIAASGGL